MKTHIEYLDIFFWKYNSAYHIEMGTYILIDLLSAGGFVAPAQLTSLWWNCGIFAQTYSTCLDGPYRKTHATGSKIGGSQSQIFNRGTEYYPVGMKTHIEYPDIFFWEYNSPYHIEMGTYILIDLLWAGGSVAPAQPTSLRWNLARSRGKWQEVEGLLFRPKNSQLVHILSFRS